MNDSEDKKEIESIITTEEQAPTAPAAEPAAAQTPDAPAPAAFNSIDEKAPEKNRGSGSYSVSEYAAFGIKVMAIIMSLVLIIVSILCVTMPLKAMRIYDNLGMSERALDSGERYIRVRLERADADKEDSSKRGTFVALSKREDLADADMIEALDTCIRLADKLMLETYNKGDRESSKYFAKKLELHTRQYASLYGVRAINRSKNEYNQANVPSIEMRPNVYDYYNTIMVLNYRARIYMDDPAALGFMLYDSGADGDCVQSIDDRYSTYAGIEQKDRISILDGFAHYVDQLSEYLGIKLARLGITGGLRESEAIANYTNVLDGSEFTLFIDPEKGFTPLYYSMKNFSEYAQAAVNLNVNTLDEMLHQIYFVRIFATFARRMRALNILLYRNLAPYSTEAKSQINAEHYTGDSYTHVIFDDGFGDPQKQLTYVYEVLLKNYVKAATAV